MVRQNYNNLLEEEVGKKHKRREKKRKIKMKVSGAGVKRLQGIIIRKQKNNLSLRGARRGRRSNLS